MKRAWLCRLLSCKLAILQGNGQWMVRCKRNGCTVCTRSVVGDPYNLALSFDPTRGINAVTNPSDHAVKLNQAQIDQWADLHRRPNVRMQVEQGADHEFMVEFWDWNFNPPRMMHEYTIRDDHV